MKRLFLILFALLCFNCSAFEHQFYIKNYDIDINVSQDNTYHIKEQINVYFNRPSHGIYRKIPTKNIVKRDDYSKYKNRAKIRNFKATDFSSKTYKNDYVLYKLGNPNRKIIGEKTYLIEYDYVLSNNSLKYDEFYFNLIGDDWNAKIQNVNFKINMPKKFDVDLIGFSTGKYGTVGNEGQIKYKSDGYQIKGYNLKELSPYEGLTIRVELPQNYFAKSKKSKMATFNYFFAVIVLTLMCVLTWYVCGKDEPVIPVVSFKPPKGLSSPQMATIYKDKVDSDSVSGLFLFLASKGYLQINENDGIFTLTKTKEYDGKDKAIKVLFQELFRDFDCDMPIYKIRKSKDFHIALLEYEKSLELLRRKIYDPNSISVKNYIFPVICSLINLIIFLYAANDFTPDMLIDGIGSILPIVVALIMFLTLFFNKRNTIATKIFIAIYCFVLGFPSALLLFNLGLFSTFFSAISIVSLICFIISVICTKNMPRKNKAGRKILGEILGFKKFIETVEKHKLEILSKGNPNYIHEIIPYAYALNIDGIWLDKISQFEVVPSLDWYNGDNFDKFAFMEYRTKTNDSIIASRNYGSSSSSSSGFGSGGGCCGGGSGGGGGGAW